MKRIASVLLATVLCACSPQHENEADREEEVSLYNEHDGLTLPADMQRELGIQLMCLKNTSAIPESAIIRGAKEDFTYVLNGKHFVRTPLERLSPGDQVVTHGVKDLWMIELLAIRGGEPCCPAD
jgi:hypothetical protein